MGKELWEGEKGDEGRERERERWLGGDRVKISILYGKVSGFAFLFSSGAYFPRENRSGREFWRASIHGKVQRTGRKGKEFIRTRFNKWTTDVCREKKNK